MDDIEKFMDEALNSVLNGQKLGFFTWFIECQLKYKISQEQFYKLIVKNQKYLKEKGLI